MSRVDQGGPLRCGRYALLARLGGGGMADVWKGRVAEAVGPERVLVIKVLPEGADPHAAARFVQEAKIALPLTHGNVTATFEFGREGDRPFLVMEYVHGQSLRDILGRCAQHDGTLRVAEALFVCREVARALRYAHNFVDVTGRKSPIVHRDVSPENVLVSYGGQVKLTDFGIARSVEALSAPAAWGKPAYVAPEILTGDPGGPRADVYSLACLVYEMLTGRPPLLGATEAETLDRVRREAPAPLSSVRTDVPRELSDLVTWALAKDPGRRLGSANEMEMGLSSVLSRLAPQFTESDLAETMSRLFGAEIRQDSSAAEDLEQRLRSQLAGAGISTTGGESAAEMLAMGTIALPSDAASPAPPAAAPRGRTRTADLEQPSTAGALLATAIGLSVLIIGGIVGFWVYFRGTNGGGGAQDAAVARLDGQASLADVGVSQDTGAKVTPSHDGGNRAPDARRAEGGVRPPRKRYATVTFNSDPWSYVYVDGEKLPGHTPIRDHKLLVGSHRVRFVNPELGLSTDTSIRLRPGESRFLKVNLGGASGSQ